MERRRQAEYARAQVERTEAVLELILYAAGPKIPPNPHDVLAELANATVEYLTGTEGELAYGGPSDSKFEDRVYRYVKMMRESPKIRLSPRLNKAIKLLFENNPQIPRDVHSVVAERTIDSLESITGNIMMLDSPNRMLSLRIEEAIGKLINCTRSSNNTLVNNGSSLYSAFNRIKSTELGRGYGPDNRPFQLSDSTLSRINYKVRSEFPVAELRILNELGKLMRKYIARDLAAVERYETRSRIRPT